MTGGTHTILVADERNANRMPDWHQLDLRTDKSFPTRWGSVSVYLALQNVYGRRNLYQIQYRRDGTRDDVSDVPWFPLPLFGLSTDF